MDVVLLTLDCWRHDAPAEMPQLQALTADYSTHDLICRAESTGGVLPTILASPYPFDAYTDTGLNPNLTTLPEVLSQARYKTAGFVAGNPFLFGWKPFFDTFWNAGYEHRDENLSKLAAATSYAKRLALFQQEIPAKGIGKRARKWFEATNGPRFLWMHLMDPHEPYHPGFTRARSLGAVRSWRALLEYRFRHPRSDEHLSQTTQTQIRRLYWAAIDRLDATIHRCLDFIPDDALVLVFGDHGEELHHGLYYHARLYDEVVRVPLPVHYPDSDYKSFTL